jgi:hypothetical protein
MSVFFDAPQRATNKYLVNSPVQNFDPNKGNMGCGVGYSVKKLGSHTRATSGINAKTKEPVSK